MLTWKDFAAAQPDLAAAGRSQLYQWNIGIGFLATVRPDGAPRLHPVCPVVSAEAVHVLIMSGPKQRDLLNDGRYSLHSETCPPPRHDDGFSISGRAVLIDDPAVKRQFRAQLEEEREGQLDWPTFDQDLLFELLLDRALLMLTESDGRFAKGATVWRAS